jgi:DNA-nicking Smr family endonuclease
MARPLDSDEKALWGRVIATVKPIHAAKKVALKKAEISPAPTAKPAPPAKRVATAIKTTPANRPLAKSVTAKPTGQLPANNLDGHWDRRLGSGSVIPDVSVDLHGTGLSGAYNRLDGALEQSISQHMRVILLVTGRARSHDRHSGEGRGAIASVVRDWLAASRHAASIAAVRNAHPRHGGAGALYIILKQRR